MVGIRVCRNTKLDGKHHMLAPSACQGLAHYLFRLASGVAISGVNEVDPGVERLVNDPDRLVMIRVAKGTEHHRAEAQLADRDAGAAEGAVLHDCIPPSYTEKVE